MRVCVGVCTESFGVCGLWVSYGDEAASCGDEYRVWFSIGEGEGQTVHDRLQSIGSAPHSCEYHVLQGHTSVILCYGVFGGNGMWFNNEGWLPLVYDVCHDEECTAEIDHHDECANDCDGSVVVLRFVVGV